MQHRLRLQTENFERGAFMKQSNTRTVKPMKLRTAIMKRRALKLKPVAVSPRRTRSLQVRALVESPSQPLGM
jgi:hypothetical protein